MSRFEGPQGIVTNGLVLNLDAGDPDSFTRSQPPYVEVLVVAGGGGGGFGEANYLGDAGGGGGAGGVIYNSAYQITNAAAITVTVGSGGVGSQYTVNGSAGSNSVFGSLTAIGGGLGCNQETNASSINNGGSGGGGGGSCTSGTKIAGSGTAGQGFNGGISLDNATFFCNVRAGGGGGGAGGPGLDAAVGGVGGNGGPGNAYSISGTSTYYGGGGGGGGAAGNTTGGGLGGIGGGGSGSGAYNGSATLTGQHGTANTGGGGGSAGSGVGTAGNGGSGIVIVRYPGLPAATGGTIAYLNGYTIHTFTTSGTFTPYLWNDVSGNGKNATFINGIPSDSFVNYIKGGYMSGFSTDDYWNVGNTPYGVIPTGTSTRTIFAAFRTPTTLNSSLYYHIFHYGTATTDNAFGLAIFNNLLNNHTWAGNSNFSNFTLSADTDYIVAVRFDNGNSPRNNFFVNGTFGTTGFGQGKTADYAINTGTANEPRVGMRIDSPTEGLNNGRVYCLYVYNRYLSNDEITQNYNALRPRIGI
jgi:hypothetical protein